MYVGVCVCIYVGVCVVVCMYVHVCRCVCKYVGVCMHIMCMLVYRYMYVSVYVGVLGKWFPFVRERAHS